MNILNLPQIPNGNKSYADRTCGQTIRRIFNLNAKDKDDLTYNILVPKGTTSILPGFYLSLFFQSIKTLGFEKYDKKYNIVFADKHNKSVIEALQKDINEARRHARNSLSDKSGLSSFLQNTDPR